MLAQRFLLRRNARRLAALQRLQETQTCNNNRKRGPLREGGRLDLDALEEEEWRNQFRFTRGEVEELVIALQLPDLIRADNRITEDPRTALCMLLDRLAYPNRLCDLAQKFGWPVERVSRISTATQTIIHNKWSHLLDWDVHRLTPERLAKYAYIIEKKGAPNCTVWGFIDGTIRVIALPTQHQRTCYNGWKRKHSLKYHAVVTPNRLISQLFGPVDGPQNDAFLW
ncbi:hypothetical protein HOY82DRAFT_604264 [Tuber indicum]|nr:hypothetical protein HOY82DRAFT_604264 [Tuber indicum]